MEIVELRRHALDATQYRVVGVTIGFQVTADRIRYISVQLIAELGKHESVVERVAVDVAEQTLESIAGESPDDSPRVRYRGFGDSSIDFDVVIPANKFADQSLIRHEFIKRLHQRFNEEGIEIPFPIRTLVMSKTENDSAGDTAETPL